MVNARIFGAALADCDPVLSIWLACLNRAKSDAAQGDLSAVAWLATTGIELAEAIAPDSGADLAITQLCRQVLADVDRGELRQKWAISEY
jgi:hypothetical protein